MFVVGRDDEGDESYGAVQWEKTEKEPRFSIGRVRRDPQLGGSSHTILHGFPLACLYERWGHYYTTQQLKWGCEKSDCP
jgi:hypothetical protein